MALAPGLRSLVAIDAHHLHARTTHRSARRGRTSWLPSSADRRDGRPMNSSQVVSNICRPALWCRAGTGVAWLCRQWCERTWAASLASTRCAARPSASAQTTRHSAPACGWRLHAGPRAAAFVQQPTSSARTHLLAYVNRGSSTASPASVNVLCARHTKGARNMASASWSNAASMRYLQVRCECGRGRGGGGVGRAAGQTRAHVWQL
jgi:hypothetical protein